MLLKEASAKPIEKVLTGENPKCHLLHEICHIDPSKSAEKHSASAPSPPDLKPTSPGHPRRRCCAFSLCFDDIAFTFNHRFAGEWLAIEEFNQENPLLKIDK